MHEHPGNVSPSHPQSILEQMSDAFIVHPGAHCPADFIPI